MGNEIGNGLASIAICILGGVSMYITRDLPEPTGVGWAVFALFLLWC